MFIITLIILNLSCETTGVNYLLVNVREVSSLSLTSVFGFFKHLREISDSLAAKCFTMFTSWPLTVSICCLVLSRACKVAVLELFHEKKNTCWV